MWSQLNFLDILNATSSPESVSGPTPCDKPDGPTTVPCGQEAARANLSARQAKAAGLMTSGTYGPRSIISSASADLSSCLANRLRAKTDLLGSTLFKLTWKVRITPSERFWKDSPGMATTGTNPDGSERMRLDQLPRQAQLATPACTCPTECDCQSPDTNPALVSFECPVHNDNPLPSRTCPIHGEVVRTVEHPLAHGAPARMGRLRGYGNSLVAAQAQAFIEAYLKSKRSRP
jgi:hypothetical protein